MVIGDPNRGNTGEEDDRRLMEVSTNPNATTIIQHGSIYNVDNPKEQEKQSDIEENMQMEEGRLYTIQVEYMTQTNAPKSRSPISTPNKMLHRPYKIHQIQSRQEGVLYRVPSRT